jgi:hypothetical protein
VKTADRIRFRWWLVLIGCLLAVPPQLLRAETGAHDSLVISASVQSQIVVTGGSVSAKCTIYKPAKQHHHEHHKDKHKHKRYGWASAHSGKSHHHDKHQSTDSYCVLKLPVSLHVLSNEAWSGTISATDTRSVSAPSVRARSLRVSTTRPTSWQAAANARVVTTSPTSWGPTTGAGESTASLYLVLALPDKCSPSQFSAKLTLTLTQVHSSIRYSLRIPITFKSI